MEIDIFGSCISRDPFEFESSHYKPGKYISRASLVSAVNQHKYPLDYSVDLGSQFKNRILDDDLNKTFNKYMSESKNSVVLIDLIQERYGVVKSEDGLYTFSHDFRTSKFLYDEIIRFDNHFKLFESKIHDITELLSSYDTVILHQAELTPLYHKNEGGMGKLLINQTDEYYMMNSSKYYNLLREYLPNSFTISIKGFYGTENHKWGKGKAHYEDAYQHKFNEAIKYVIENKKYYYYLNNYGILGEEVIK